MSLRRRVGVRSGGGPVVNLCGKLTPRESAGGVFAGAVVCGA